ncbi:MAG TPA: septum formation protein Maf [Phycisphaerales bacterium]|nr:septum formation protein Maf [Phycisphaerales bacterium]
MVDEQRIHPRLVLASRSPRRRELLDRAGVRYELASTMVDDSGLVAGRGVEPEQWVMALAYLKAAGGCEGITGDGDVVVLGSDTVCVDGGAVLGQPSDEAHAERMLRGFVGRTHRVLTGVALVNPATGHRELFYDSAVVRWGDVDQGEIGSYIASGQWRGKAGAYNLDERLSAGWPIEYEGDPGTIMGLPMRMLLDRLSAWSVEVGA